MDSQVLFRWGIIILTVAVAYLGYLVIKPFLLTIIMSFILTFIFSPMYTFFSKKTKRKRLASVLMVIIVLLLLILPATFLVTKLVTEAASTYKAFVDADVQLDTLPIIGSLTIVEQSQNVFEGLISGVKDYIVVSTPDILGEIAGFVVHLFVFFFIMFFANISGPAWYAQIQQLTPLNPAVRKQLFSDLEKVLSAIVYGQFLTAVVQGTAGGLLFFIFGIPNAIFWGFVMIIFSFVPLLGTPLIFIPAGLIQLAQGNYVTGIGVLVIGLVVIMNMDNFVRPYLVNRFAPVHPILVLIGVLGGLKAFGFAGMIIGPLILALFFTLVKDFSKHKELLTKG